MENMVFVSFSCLDPVYSPYPVRQLQQRNSLLQPATVTNWELCWYPHGYSSWPKSPKIIQTLIMQGTCRFLNNRTWLAQRFLKSKSHPFHHRKKEPLCSPNSLRRLEMSLCHKYHKAKDSNSCWAHTLNRCMSPTGISRQMRSNLTPHFQKGWFISKVNINI